VRWWRSKSWNSGAGIGNKVYKWGKSDAFASCDASQLRKVKFFGR
jgi:hypothetical protein